MKWSEVIVKATALLALLEDANASVWAKLQAGMMFMSEIASLFLSAGSAPPAGCLPPLHAQAMAGPPQTARDMLSHMKALAPAADAGDAHANGQILAALAAFLEKMGPLFLQFWGLFHPTPKV